MPSPMWHVWLVGLVIAAISVTAISAAWHTAHDADSDCVVCEFENEPLDELAGTAKVGPGDTPEPSMLLSATTLVLTHLDEQVPARAPPLS